MRSKATHLVLGLIITFCRLATPLPLNSWPKILPSHVSSICPSKLNGGLPGASPNMRRHRSGFQHLALWLGRPDNIAGSLKRRNLFKVLGGLVVGFLVLLETYSRVGTKDSDFSSDLLVPLAKGTRWEDVEHATLVFHGSGGQDKYTDKLMANLNKMPGKASYNSMVHWSKYSTNILQASFNGQRVGRMAATQLLQKARNLKSVHLIGISVGAFAADAACSTIKSSGKDTTFVQLTLLDPFTQRGIFDVGYGAREYGRGADYFQQYLNTDDPVPSTNSPLENSVCYDITSIRPAEISFGHDWPVAYFGDQENVGIVPPKARKERGTIIKVDQ